MGDLVSSLRLATAAKNFIEFTFICAAISSSYPQGVASSYPQGVAHDFAHITFYLWGFLIFRKVGAIATKSEGANDGEARKGSIALLNSEKF
ncbi:hypothetical protein [Phormidesmis priestleyi]